MGESERGGGAWLVGVVGEYPRRRSEIPGTF